MIRVMTIFIKTYIFVKVREGRKEGREKGRNEGREEERKGGRKDGRRGGARQENQTKLMHMWMLGVLKQATE